MKRELITLVALCMTACGAGQELADGTEEAGGEQAAQTYLGYTADQCSGLLRVINKDGQLVTIQRGVQTRVDVGSYRFAWYCGSTIEATTCNVGTRYVLVTHSTSSRHISWVCSY